MSELRKAAEMALERLERTIAYSNEEMAKIDAAKHALRQALAQPEQEPVAYVSDSGSIAVMVAGTDIEDDTPLYTAPPTMPDDLIATYEKGFRDGQAKREHKPVAWMHELADGQSYCVTKDESGYVDNFTDTYKTIPLYTAPPKREHLERLCRIMGTFDLATGHADTMEQALDALESELRDVLGYLRAKCEWVGLTDEEFEEAVDGLEDLRDCWIQIEAKLKEKNA